MDFDLRARIHFKIDVELAINSLRTAHTRMVFRWAWDAVGKACFSDEFWLWEERNCTKVKAKGVKLVCVKEIKISSCLAIIVSGLTISLN